jgi:hypothetical protein
MARGLEWNWHIIIIYLLTVSIMISAVPPADKSSHCRHLVQLGGGKKPGYVAVIALKDKDEDITWASQVG